MGRKRNRTVRNGVLSDARGSRATAPLPAPATVEGGCMNTAERMHVRATDDVQPADQKATTKPASPVYPAAHSARAARLPVRGMLLPRRYRAALTALAAF